MNSIYFCNRDLYYKVKEATYILKVIYSSIVLVLFVMMVSKVLVSPKVITPLPDNFVVPVSASESKYIPTPTPTLPTWANNIQLVVGEFSRLGLQKTVEAINVAYCESRFNDKAVSKTGDYGVFQINKIHGLSDKVVFDAKKNIKWAVAKVKKEGWNAWTCKP